MYVAMCPFCGQENRGGLMPPVKPGDPTPMASWCPHHVIDVVTELAWDYLPQELHRELNDLPGVTADKDDIETILKKHLVLVGRMGFARSDRERVAANEEVRGFLTGRGYVV